MAENNPIRYSDLIQPDDSIEKLISQLEKAQEAYSSMSSTVKNAAGQMMSSLKSASGATEKGRETIQKASQAAEKLQKAYQELSFAESENAKKLAELKLAQKEANDLNKLTVKLNQSAEGSYNRLSAQYSINKIYLNNMTKAERENTEQGRKLVAETHAIYEEMKRLQEATGKTSLNVGNYGGAVKSLTQDLRMMQQALAQMEAEGLRGSEAYEELAKKAGALKDNIADARAEISRYASDTRLLSDAMDIFSTASAAYQTYQGVVQAFGVESEEAMQAMAKLQGVISVTNGLQMLHAKFTDNASATYKVYHGILRLVGLEEKAVAASTIAATAAEQQQTAATTAATTANTANAASISATTVALKAFKVALLTTGIGAIVVALGTLVSYWDDVKEFFGGVSREAKAAAETQNILADSTESSYKEYAKARAELSVYQDKVNSFNGTKKQEKELVDELNSKYGSAIGQYNNLNEWKKRLTESGEAYCLTLQKEAEMTALVSAYQDAYLAKMQAQRKWQEGGYSSWFKTAAGEARDYQRDLDAIDSRMQEIDARMKNVANEQSSLREAYNIQSPSTSKTVQTKKSGKSTKKDTTERDLEQQYKHRLDIQRAYEDAMLATEEDGLNKQRKKILYQYDRQIEDLRHKMETEKSERETMRKTIEALEIQKQEKLANLVEEAQLEELRNVKKSIDLRLQAVREGSVQEIRLKAQQIEAEKQLEIAENRKKNNGADEEAIIAKHLKRQADLYKQYTKQRSQDEYTLRTQEIQGETDTIAAILEAVEEGSLQISEKEIEALKNRAQELAKEAKDITKQAAREILDNALSILDGIRVDFSDPIDATKQLTSAIMDLKDAFNDGSFEDKLQSINTMFNLGTEALLQYAAAQVQVAEQAVQAADKQVESAQRALDAEREARNNGYAANVEMAQKELELAKRTQQKALQDKQKAQKQQEAIQTVQQIGNLVTAAALIWSQLGFPWAIPAIAVMFGSFAASKIMAANSVKSGTEEYGEGTVELLQGGSHQSGNDIDLGRKKDGTRRRAEGGEYLAVINKRNSRKYGALIPSVIKSLNDGTFTEKFNNKLSYENAYKVDTNLIAGTQEKADLSRIEAGIDKMNESLDKPHTYIDGDGNTVVKYKNVTRVIKK